MWFNGELFEIFSWLPTKDLYKFSTVCRTFNQLLFEDAFIKKQCKNMQLVGDTHFFLHHVRNFSRKVEFHAISSNNSNVLSGDGAGLYGYEPKHQLLPHASLDFLINKGSILASSNGLLCCKNVNDNEDLLFLFNPTTRSYWPIPTPDETINSDKEINLVFAYDHDAEAERSFAYLLMAIVVPTEWGAPFRCKVYSPKQNIWREGGKINTGERNLCLQYSFKHNGVIYMISDTGKYLTKDSPFYWPYVVAYDIKNSCSKFLKLPMEAWEEAGYLCLDLRIFKWGPNPNSALNSICLVKLLDNVFTVWVLNTTTNVEENNTYSYYWSQVFYMPIIGMGLSSLLDDVKVTGFTVMNGGVLLFATDKKVYSCDILGWSDVGRVEEVCGHGFGENFVNFRPFCGTLCRCGPAAATLL
ncbi:hypothetical protein CDL12_10046 [Handroanthus impetiginosus]|uniref:Uncharacterized protein n=1 Tax=Handroanthus impetiginosus TaxID=429701 RepID=A0A2G9HIE0_9LAMI|nr:hypothetical protein CDL12_10046 [Handroanthus impetiginosus]